MIIMTMTILMMLTEAIDDGQHMGEEEREEECSSSTGVVGGVLSTSHEGVVPGTMALTNW